MLQRNYDHPCITDEETEVQRIDPYQDTYQLIDDELGFLHSHSSSTCHTYPHVPFLPFYLTQKMPFV